MEVQKHGFVFEDWVKEQFFSSYSNLYGADWDIPKEINIKYGNFPISIKTAKNKSAVYLGDAIRQKNINQDFLMIVAFWEQVDSETKIIKEIFLINITKELWGSLWGEISLTEILNLDKCIKDLSTKYEDVRIRAKSINKEIRKKAFAITLNPKIDSKTQRRLQCGIPYKKFIKLFQENKLNENILWGKKFDTKINSKVRAFKK